MRIGINKIQESQYTSGGEFVEKISLKPYVGYYYAVGNIFYSGKGFDVNAIEITKVNDSTKKIDNLNLESLKYFFNSSDKTKNIISSTTNLKGIHFVPNDEVIKKGFTTRYFIKKSNNTPILIVEVTKSDYDDITGPIYSKSSLIWNISGGFNQTEIDNLDKGEMKGIKAFLSV